MLHGRSKDYMKGCRRRYFSGRFPLQKFLRSRVGQPWAKVHSEMSEEFDRRTFAGYRFWKDIAWRVETSCWVGAETGRIYSNHDYGGPSQVNGFYVHPWTGILQYQEHIIGPRQEQPVTHIPINDRNWLEKYEGIWYWIEKYEVHTEGLTTIRPNWKPQPVEVDGVVFYKIKDVEHVYHKKQLSHENLKRNNLKNDTPEEIKEAARIAAEKAKLERAIWKRRQAAQEELYQAQLAKAKEARANAANL